MKTLFSTLLICLFVSIEAVQASSIISNHTAIDTPTVTQKLSASDVEKILNSYLREVEACTKKDSVFYPLGYSEMIDDNSPLIAMGRFVDREKIYAVAISSDDNPDVTFYCYEDNKWGTIGNYKASMDVYRLDFRDFDGDGRNEIVTSGHGNMNGNYSNDFYYCSSKTNSINFAGTFFCRYDDSQIDTARMIIKVEYFGSWYANNERTIYKWVNGYLVAQKQLVIGLKNADGKHSAQFMEYYESPNPEIENLVLKFRKTYRESDKKLNYLWEHFFD
ncbi:MAG: hypothetical protein QM710_10905 [Flavobacterium sp.]